MITPKTIPLIASIVQEDLGEVRLENGVANAVIVVVEFIAKHRRASRTISISEDNRTL